MKRCFIFFSFFLSICIFAQQINPYLQAITPNSIYVNWISRENNEVSVVEYGEDSNNLNITATGSYTYFSGAGAYNYYTVKLTGLKPNTKYFYKVKSGKSVSAVKNFKTLPNPGKASTSDGHIRFLLMGDNQLRYADRYDRFVAAAKRKILDKWGADKDPCDNISMTVMVGDQVDTGTLDHYENVHFAKNKDLSGNLAIQTLVGNHETYGTLGINGYTDHFILDEMEYKGIKSGTENYYARQAGNVLFICFDTEYVKDNASAQLSWLKNIVTEAEKDNTVEWIVSLGHRPYQAEQYVGDISEWVRNTAFPVLLSTDKFVLHVGAHHHLYSRGQIKDKKVYNIISGGTAWDQYWGMSSEADFPEVQKTLPNWIYQIIDVDVVNKKFSVEAYSIGSRNKVKDNELVDSFHRYKNLPPPNKPTIITNLTSPITQPFEIAGSAYSTTTDQKLNTTQFLISKSPDFSTVDKEFYRDFENLYGKLNGQEDESNDLNKGVDITKIQFPKDNLSNGTYYVKVRYRDENMEWSEWSETQKFNIQGSNSNIIPTINVDNKSYSQTSSIITTYSNGSTNSKAWVGIYDPSQKIGGSGPSNYAWAWEYTGGKTAGSVLFNNVGTAGGNVKYGLKPGRYYAALFKDSGYTVLAKTDMFYIGATPQYKTNKQDYEASEKVILTFTQAPKLSGDKISIFNVGKNYGNGLAAKEIPITTEAGTHEISGLNPGYYYADYYVQGSDMTIGERIFFKVGNIVTKLSLNKPQYELGESIVAKWTDAPGIAKDWIGIYKKGDNPNTDSSEESGYTYTYFDGLPEGKKTIGSKELPKKTGEFFAVIFTNDSYNEISNRVYFEVVNSTLGTDESSTKDEIKIYPNPTNQNQPTYIESRFPISKVSLYDMSGKLLYTTNNVNNNRYSLISQNLPKGIYIITIEGRKLFSYRLIVK